MQLLFCPFELLLNSRAVVFHNGGGAYSSSFLLSRSLELTFWFYVKEHLNRHELQRFYSLRQISSELGRGRAWLRCALNEHSLERYLHTLLADRPRLGLVTSPLVSYAPHTVSQLGGNFLSFSLVYRSFVFSRSYYEDWAFVLDEERASMLPTMAAGELVFWH